MPRAFITGITGQDGQHLAEFLHDKGYDVYLGRDSYIERPDGARLPLQLLGLVWRRA